MKKLLFTACLLFYPVTSVWAELPREIQVVRTDSMQSEQNIMTLEQQNKLQERLRSAVFMAYANQPKPFALADSGITLDGACVAIPPSAVQEIIPDALTAKDTDATAPNTPEQDSKPKSDDAIGRQRYKATSPFAKRNANDSAPDSNADTANSRNNTANSHTPFGSHLYKSTSLFHKETEEKAEIKSSRQYFLTTADWLTLSTSIEILIHGKKVPAKLEFRDDLQNLAILSTPLDPGIHPVTILEPEQHIPQHVFVLLSPNSIYESMTLHPLAIQQMHQYGTTSLPVRNGYPLFSTDAHLAGLTVGPDKPGSKSTNVVHPGLIDRALHPAKYNIDVHEDVKLTEY